MEKQITFRSMEHSGGLENHALSRLAKIEHFLDLSENTPVTIHMIITGGFVHAHHKVELLVKTPHYDLVAHEESKDAYQAITDVVHKMFAELTRAKEKMIHDRKTGNQHRSNEQMDANFETPDEEGDDTN